MNEAHPDRGDTQRAAAVFRDIAVRLYYLLQKTWRLGSTALFFLGCSHGFGQQRKFWSWNVGKMELIESVCRNFVSRFHLSKMQAVSKCDFIVVL